MIDERTKAEKLASTLDYLIREGIIPGLLPKDVSAAAELLRDQEAELKTLRAAQATKEHVVEATAEDEHYRKKIRATFIITDPRIYYAEMMVDDRMASLATDQHDWQLHVARQLVRCGTQDWIRDLEERAFVAIRKAIAGDTRSAETRNEVPSEG